MTGSPEVSTGADKAKGHCGQDLGALILLAFARHAGTTFPLALHFQGGSKCRTIVLGTDGAVTL